MSGFAGIINIDGATPDRALVERMAAHLAFRGESEDIKSTLNAA